MKPAQSRKIPVRPTGIVKNLGIGNANADSTTQASRKNAHESRTIASQFRALPHRIPPKSHMNFAQSRKIPSRPTGISGIGNANSDPTTKEPRENAREFRTRAPILRASAQDYRTLAHESHTLSHEFRTLARQLFALPHSDLAHSHMNSARPHTNFARLSAGFSHTRAIFQRIRPEFSRLWELETPIPTQQMILAQTHVNSAHSRANFPRFRKGFPRNRT